MPLRTFLHVANNREEAPFQPRKKETSPFGVKYAHNCVFFSGLGGGGDRARNGVQKLVGASTGTPQRQSIGHLSLSLSAPFAPARSFRHRTFEEASKDDWTSRYLRRPFQRRAFRNGTEGLVTSLRLRIRGTRQSTRGDHLPSFFPRE